jgi:hypothetical protein
VANADANHFETWEVSGVSLYQTIVVVSGEDIPGIPRLLCSYRTTISMSEFRESPTIAEANGMKLKEVEIFVPGRLCILGKKSDV